MGNQLTPKEYFENSIQQQKGSSDQVETKNRIRRLIKHFFHDRDCYTLVRPVEEEKELQSLQSMGDHQLRQEFVAQVNQLRNKIYKRVKPKQLNSKFLTGQMLLELCYAYTNAINTGSVPNIQNAWTYVCQNECLRAIQESINQYSEQMQQVLAEAKLKCDQEMLKKCHRPARDQAVSSFKHKAVGGEIVAGYESQLRDGIDKKYKEIKSEFGRSCRQKVIEWLDPEVSTIRRNINGGIYEDMDKIKEDLDKLKAKLIEQGPRFTGKLEIFAEIQLQLVVKAGDYMTIASRQESDQSLKRVQEKLRDLQQSSTEAKEQSRTEVMRQYSRIQELEQKLNDSIRNEKILEERLKYLQEERNRLESNLNERLTQENSINTDKISSLENKLRSVENQLKQRDEDYFRKSNEFDKLHALIDQKLHLTERELAEYKVKYQSKDVESKEASKELYATKKELQKLQSEIQKQSQEKQEELKALKADYESQIEQLQQQQPQSASDHQQLQWNKERSQLHDQLKSLTEGLNAQKQFQEHLMNMMKSGAGDQDKINKYKEKNKELMSTNQNLSQQIVQMQGKQMNLEKDITSLKSFKYLVHCSIALQCRSCNKLYPKNQYSQHLVACNQENERMSTLIAQHNIYPTSIQVFNCIIDNRVPIYEIIVEKNFQQWKVQKSISDFKKFFDSLYSQFPSYSHIIPFIQEEWLDFEQNSPDFYTKDIKIKLQSQMQDLAGIPFIRENLLFKHFLDFEGNYFGEEENYDPRRTILNPNSQGSFISNAHTLPPHRSSILNPFQAAGIRHHSQSFVQNGGARNSVVPEHQFKHLQEPNDSQNKPRLTALNEVIQQRSMIQEMEDEDFTSMESNQNRLSDLLDGGTPSTMFDRRDDSSVILRQSQKGGGPTPYQPGQRHIEWQQSNSIVEYGRPSLQINGCEDDFDNDNGDPIVQVIQNDEDFLDFEATHKIIKIDPQTLQSEQINLAEEDSFSREIGKMQISARKSNLPTYSDDDSGRPSDIENTKANLASKFELEAVPQSLPEVPIYFKQSIQQSSSQMSSAKKDNQRYLKEGEDYEMNQ